MAEQSENKPKRQTAHPNLLAGNPEHGFQPGQSGNPNGRPENENSITYWLKHELAQPNGGGRPTAHSIAKGIIAEAKKRKPWACEFVLDRTEGKAKQSMEVTGKDGKDLIPDAAAALDAKLAGIAATITAADGADDTDG